MFDDMIVPWERIFLLDDVELGNRTVVRVALWRHYMQQVAVKNIAKLEFILGITTGVYGHVQEENGGDHRHQRNVPRLYAGRGGGRRDAGGS